MKHYEDLGLPFKLQDLMDDLKEQQSRHIVSVNDIFSHHFHLLYLPSYQGSKEAMLIVDEKDGEIVDTTPLEIQGDFVSKEDADKIRQRIIECVLRKEEE